MGGNLMAVRLSIYFLLQADWGVRHVRSHDEALHDDSGNDDAEAKNGKKVFKHIDLFRFA